MDTNPTSNEITQGPNEGYTAFELRRANATIQRLRTALWRIAKWFGEFPSTGRTWDDGSPMSYGACFGSNGERDYMRDIAQAALSASSSTPSSPVETTELRAENTRLGLLVSATANHWLSLQSEFPIPWEGAIDAAMEAACNEIRRLRSSPLETKEIPETPEQRRARIEANALEDAHRMYEREHGEPFPGSGSK